MSAVVAAMAGAAAGAAARQRRLDEIDHTFEGDATRQNARHVMSLIQETEGGNPLIAIALFVLGLPAMFAGGTAGGKVAGDPGVWIGCVLGLVVLYATGLYADARWCQRPARQELARFVTSIPDGERVEKEVRRILGSG